MWTNGQKNTLTSHSHNENFFDRQTKQQKIVRGIAVLPPALGHPGTPSVEKSAKDVGSVKAK